MVRRKNNESVEDRSKVERLVDIMFSDAEVGVESMTKLRLWLSDPEKEEEKSAALYAKFIEKFQYNPQPVLAPALWPDLARRLGLDETPVAASYDPLAPRGRNGESRTVTGSVSGSVPETPESLKGRETEVQTRRKLSFRQTVLRVAAVLVPVALVLGGALWLIDRGAQGDVMAVTVPEGTTQTIELPDGSTVEAEGGATVSWDEKTFAADRAVTLSGEALFDVTEVTTGDGVRIPFSVTTDDLAVEVLGTVFRLAENDGAAEPHSAVSLYEGSVGVKIDATADMAGEAQAGTILSRGERLRVNAGTGELLTELIPASEMALHGVMPLLRFEESTLADLVVALEMNFGVKVAVADGIDTAAGRYSADFEGTALDDVVRIMSRVDTGLSWERGGDVINIKKR